MIRTILLWRIRRLDRKIAGHRAVVKVLDSLVKAPHVKIHPDFMDRLEAHNYQVSYAVKTREQLISRLDPYDQLLDYDKMSSAPGL